MKLGQYHEYLVSTVNSERMVLQHQGISGYSAEFPAVNGLTHLPLVVHICVSDSGEHWFR